MCSLIFPVIKYLMSQSLLAQQNIRRFPCACSSVLSISCTEHSIVLGCMDGCVHIAPIQFSNLDSFPMIPGDLKKDFTSFRVTEEKLPVDCILCSNTGSASELVMIAAFSGGHTVFFFQLNPRTKGCHKFPEPTLCCQVALPSAPNPQTGDIEDLKYTSRTSSHTWIGSNTLLVGCYEGPIVAVTLSENKKGVTCRILIRELTPITQLDYDEHSRSLLVSSLGRNVLVVDLSKESIANIMYSFVPYQIGAKEREEGYFGACFHPKSKRIYSARHNHRIFEADQETAKVVKTFRLEDSAPIGLLKPIFLDGDEEDSVRLWSETPELVCVLYLANTHSECEAVQNFEHSAVIASVALLNFYVVLAADDNIMVVRVAADRQPFFPEFLLDPPIMKEIAESHLVDEGLCGPLVMTDTARDCEAEVLVDGESNSPTPSRSKDVRPANKSEATRRSSTIKKIRVVKKVIRKGGITTTIVQHFDVEGNVIHQSTDDVKVSGPPMEIVLPENDACLQPLAAAPIPADTKFDEIMYPQPTIVELPQELENPTHEIMYPEAAVEGPILPLEDIVFHQGCSPSGEPSELLIKAVDPAAEELERVAPTVTLPEAIIIAPQPTPQIPVVYTLFDDSLNKLYRTHTARSLESRYQPQLLQEIIALLPLLRCRLDDLHASTRAPGCETDVATFASEYFNMDDDSDEDVDEAQELDPTAKISALLSSALEWIHKVPVPPDEKKLSCATDIFAQLVRLPKLPRKELADMCEKCVRTMSPSEEFEDLVRTICYCGVQAFNCSAFPLYGCSPRSHVHLRRSATAKDSETSCDIELLLRSANVSVLDALEKHSVPTCAMFHYFTYLFIVLPSKCQNLLLEKFPHISISFVEWALSTAVQDAAWTVIANGQCDKIERMSNDDLADTLCDFTLMVMQAHRNLVLSTNAFPQCCHVLLSRRLQLIQESSLISPTPPQASVDTHSPLVSHVHVMRKLKRLEDAVIGLFQSSTMKVTVAFPTVRSMCDEFLFPRGVFELRAVEASIEEHVASGRVDKLLPLFQCSDLITEAHWITFFVAAHGATCLEQASFLCLTVVQQAKKVRYLVRRAFPFMDAPNLDDDQLKTVSQKLAVLIVQ